MLKFNITITVIIHDVIIKIHITMNFIIHITMNYITKIEATIL